MRHRITIETDFRIGDMVYHRCDNERGMVTGLKIGPGNEVRLVELTFGANCEAWVLPMEISHEESPDWNVNDGDDDCDDDRHDASLN